MQNVWIGLALLFASCGGTQKGAGALGGDTQGMAQSGGNEDMKIPRVDPTLCETAGKEIELYDLNRDNKPDVWKLFKTEDERGTKARLLSCKQVDLDHDGRKDYVGEYDDSGALLLEEYDFDFDGRFDVRIHYDKKNGKRYLVERETGFDNQPDIWEKYTKDEVLDNVRRDRNGDSRPDYWEQYRAGVLMSIQYDDDFDGKVDRQEQAGEAARPAQPVPATTAPGENQATPPAGAAPAAATVAPSRAAPQ